MASSTQALQTRTGGQKTRLGIENSGVASRVRRMGKHKAGPGASFSMQADIQGESAMGDWANYTNEAAEDSLLLTKVLHTPFFHFSHQLSLPPFLHLRLSSRAITRLSIAFVCLLQLRMLIVDN